MFLYQKGVDFETEIVNLPGQETQSPWYLKINPKGEVPALKHGDTIISGSDEILEYLEKNEIGAKSLYPSGVDEAKRHAYWMTKLVSLPIGPITYGTAYHPDIRKVKKGPVIGSNITRMKNFMDNRSAVLRQKAVENAGTPAEAALLAKAEDHDQKLYLFTSEVEYKRMLKEVNDLLDEVEAEFEAHKSFTLNGKMFTAADCILAVTLNRLHWIGHEDYVINKKRPQITKYWRNALPHREAFVKSTYCPNLMVYMLKDKMEKNTTLIFGYALCGLLAALIYSFLNNFFQ